MPEADHQIQPAPLNYAEPLRPGKQSEPDRIDRGILARPVGSRYLSQEILFGGFAGLLLGALAGETSCWLGGQDDRLASGALIGAGLGAVVGVVIAIAQVLFRGPIVKADTATIIGITYGLSPGLIGALVTNAGQLFSGGALVEVLVGGPIVGLFLGAVLERAFDAGRRNAWGRGLAIATVVVAVCGCIGWLMVWKPCGPDPSDLAKRAKSMILSKWDQDGGMRDAKIESITLARKTGIQYTGFFDATIEGFPQRFTVSVIATGETIGVTWEPVDQDLNDD